MAWHFDNDMPIYTQLVSQIERMIASGDWQAGEKIPTVRDLAIEAGVNPNTVQRAFQELERTGLVYSQRSSGRFVTDSTETVALARRNIAYRETAGYVKSMEQLGFSRQEMAETVLSFKEEKNDAGNI